MESPALRTMFFTGCIENTITLYGQYLPKAPSFASWTDAGLLELQHKLKRRPRKLRFGLEPIPANSLWNS